MCCAVATAGATVGAHAAAPLPAAEAAVWLQKMADATRRLSYEGTFVVHQGDTMQSYSVANRPTAQGNESVLISLDGSQREVRCDQNGAVTVMADGSQVRMERRLSRRHFPYLLPANPQSLANWYEVRLGDMARVAGLECRNLEMVPRDTHRWGYQLCAEKNSNLPLKAMVINGSSQPLMQYAFAEIKLATSGNALKPLSRTALPTMPEAARGLDGEHVTASTLPPGFSRIAAVKRHLPDMPGEVEHWVFSDGLTHISLFLSPTRKPVETVRGESARGMVNLMRRQVGDYQATVLGDAPWSAVETLASGLEPKK